MKWFPKGALIASLLSTALVGLEAPETQENKPSYRSTNFYISTSGITLTPGVRWQRGHFGFDAGVSFMLVMPVGVKLSGLYYFNPYSDSLWQHNMSVGVIAGAFVRGPYITYGFQREFQKNGYWFMNIGGGWGWTEIDVPQNFPMPVINLGYAF